MSADSPARTSTRDTILDAAENLFATRGFRGPSIKNIGEAADINPALLYYYFHDKTGLYRAVLRRIGDGLLSQGKQAIRASADPATLVRAIVTAQSVFISRHPNAAAILVREMIDHQASHCEPMIHEIEASLFRPLVAAIEQGQAQGIFRSGIDSRRAAISIVAQNAYFRLARPVVRILLNEGDDFPTPSDLERFGAHAADFAVAALRGEG